MTALKQISNERSCVTSNGNSFFYIYLQLGDGIFIDMRINNPLRKVYPHHQVFFFTKKLNLQNKKQSRPNEVYWKSWRNMILYIYRRQFYSALSGEATVLYKAQFSFCPRKYFSTFLEDKEGIYEISVLFSALYFVLYIL